MAPRKEGADTVATSRGLKEIARRCSELRWLWFRIIWWSCPGSLVCGCESKHILTLRLCGRFTPNPLHGPQTRPQIPRGGGCLGFPDQSTEPVGEDGRACADGLGQPSCLSTNQKGHEKTSARLTDSTHWIWAAGVTLRSTELMLAMGVPQESLQVWQKRCQHITTILGKELLNP